MFPGRSAALSPAEVPKGTGAISAWLTSASLGEQFRQPIELGKKHEISPLYHLLRSTGRLRRAAALQNTRPDD